MRVSPQQGGVLGTRNQREEGAGGPTGETGGVGGGVGENDSEPHQESEGETERYYFRDDKTQIAQRVLNTGTPRLPRVSGSG